MAWVREYNLLRGDGNTGGAKIAYEDVCKCKVSQAALDESLTKDFASELGLSTKGGPIMNDETTSNDGEFTEERRERSKSIKEKECAGNF